jgi:hypothetical protein
MLYGPWTEAKPQSNSGSRCQWVVCLPDDEPSAMQVILDIVHGNFDKVPVTPWALDLYHVVVIADKYHMFRCLRPWAAHWRRVVIQNLVTVSNLSWFTLRGSWATSLLMSLGYKI